MSAVGQLWPSDDDDKVLGGDDDFDDGDEEMNHQDELVEKLQV